MDVAREVLFEYLKNVFNLRRGNNKPFRGYLFTCILSKYLVKCIPESYRIVLGPLWIKGLEWIEWDMAIVRRCARPHYNRWYNPNDVIVLFECKVNGVYGSRDKLNTLLNKIKDNFKQAHEICRSLRGCLYVSLMEVKPKGEDSINYYEKTKNVIKNSIIFFNSRSIRSLSNKYRNNPNRVVEEAESLDSWDKLIKKIDEILVT